MGTFIRFVIQNLHFIVFIILEIISINLAVNYDNRRKSIFLSTSNQVSGFVQSYVNNATQYFQLGNENENLVRENALLKNKLLNLEQKLERESNQPDSLTINRTDGQSNIRYRVIPAQVISNSFSSLHNFLTINAGENSGIKPGMGVVTSSGPVGIVTRVNKNYSKVISMYNVENSVSAMVKKSNALGVVQWDPYNLKTLVMREIPRHVELEKGDTIVTSGYSFSFPPDLPIGKIDHFNLESGENDYTVYVRLFEDLYTLRSCYIIEDLWGQTLDDTTNLSDEEVQ